MSTVAVRELRNHTADVLRRVEAGESITITVNGVEVANLVPVHRTKRRFIPKEEFLRTLRQADPGLRDDLALLAGETTDDLGPIR
jgi:prevent-host-death family protein